jgi:hypothetical protein
LCLVTGQRTLLWGQEFHGNYCSNRSQY